MAGLGLPFFSKESPLDTVSGEGLEEAYRNRVELTAGQRLQLMYRIDEGGELSPELDGVKQSSFLAFIVSTIIGGQQAGSEAYKRYMVEAKNKMFENPRLAQMEMADRLRMACAKGAWKYGRKVTGLTFVYTLTATTLCVARNDVTPLEHAAAGFVTGAGWRIIQGPRAMLGAGLVGSAFGAVAGGLLMGLNWISGDSQEERWKRSYLREQELLAQEQEKRRFARDTAEKSNEDSPFNDKMWDLRRRFRLRVGLETPEIPEDFEDKTSKKLDELGDVQSESSLSKK